MTNLITLENGNQVEPGCWFDGAHGWTNSYRVVDLAVHHGMELDAEDAAVVEWYRSSGDSDADASDDELSKLEAMTGQGGLSDKATDYLMEQLPEGWTLRWDDGLTCLRDWEDCAADGNGCEVDVDTAGNIVLVKRCADHNPCEGHVDTDDALTSGVGIGEAVYCDGSCVPQS
jgi:hypothetical protein